MLLCFFIVHYLTIYIFGFINMLDDCYKTQHYKVVCYENVFVDVTA